MEGNIELKVVSDIDTKEVETELLQTKKVSEEVVEKSLNYDALLPEEKKAVDEFLEKVDVSNTTQILQYGANAQNNISKFSDRDRKSTRLNSSHR